MPNLLFKEALTNAGDRQASKRRLMGADKGKGGATWGCAEAFLGAGVGHVNAPGICKEGDASQGAHGVHNQQGAVLLAQLTKPF